MTTDRDYSKDAGGYLAQYGDDDTLAHAPTKEQHDARVAATGRPYTYDGIKQHTTRNGTQRSTNAGTGDADNR